MTLTISNAEHIKQTLSTIRRRQHSKLLKS